MRSCACAARASTSAGSRRRRGGPRPSSRRRSASSRRGASGRSRGPSRCTSPSVTGGSTAWPADRGALPPASWSRVSSWRPCSSPRSWSWPSLSACWWASCPSMRFAPPSAASSALSPRARATAWCPSRARSPRLRSAARSRGRSGGSRDNRDGFVLPVVRLLAEEAGSTWLGRLRSRGPDGREAGADRSRGWLRAARWLIPLPWALVALTRGPDLETLRLWAVGSGDPFGGGRWLSWVPPATWAFAFRWGAVAAAAWLSYRIALAAWLAWTRAEQDLTLRQGPPKGVSARAPSLRARHDGGPLGGPRPGAGGSPGGRELGPDRDRERALRAGRARALEPDPGRGGRVALPAPPPRRSAGARGRRARLSDWRGQRAVDGRSTRLPCSSTVAVKPGCTSVLASGSSTIAGPSIALPRRSLPRSST
jgi:hypothetical protein